MVCHFLNLIIEDIDFNSTRAFNSEVIVLDRLFTQWISALTFFLCCRIPQMCQSVPPLLLQYFLTKVPIVSFLSNAGGEGDNISLNCQRSRTYSVM